MDGAQVISMYQAILAITSKMLTAAQNNQWDELVSLEQECKQLTKALTKEESGTILDKELLQKKISIIHQILDDDAQIRTITEPWMNRLQEMLNANKQTRNLQHAYQTISNI